MWLIILCYWNFYTLPSFQVIHDVNCIVSEVRGDYLGLISHYLSSCPSEVLDVVRKSMLQGVESLETVLPLVKKTIIEVIVDKSVEVKPWRNTSKLLSRVSYILKSG